MACLVTKIFKTIETEEQANDQDFKLVDLVAQGTKKNRIKMQNRGSVSQNFDRTKSQSRVHSEINHTISNGQESSPWEWRSLSNLVIILERMNTSSLFHNPVLNFIKEVFLTAEVRYGTACLWRCGN